ncbi:glucan 1,4-alpha-glucosidase [Rhizobium rhizosphaerae]|uniref:Glucan 1,4-alpha-glucosidase n=1 Tax=Xaviernesmea rhizosphaerae TaxID=1672749 RepID=A0A1Q9AD71_9HYPH|nr:glucan 1,4-alpha-glucosidase [Xaviernesmea rhizosphaerae]OLP52847.1 glucan 1,4-alpha-glucosidase [Xaviernesmea rhizosphaerae]
MSSEPVLSAAIAAPGAPGIAGRWTSSAKSGLGTALSAASPVWFTLSHGIVNEVYHPRVDLACTRDLGLLVTRDDGYFSEEKRHAAHACHWLHDGIPAFHLENVARDGAYAIDKTVLTDPRRPVLLQKIRFRPLAGSIADYRVHALLSPHLVNAGAGNSAWTGHYKGFPMLFASGKGQFLALASSLPWAAMSAGYVGQSDGWRQLSETGRLAPYGRALDGNVALTGLIGFGPQEDAALLALAFGASEAEAGYHALASLQDGYEGAARAYVAGWQAFQRDLLPLESGGRKGAHLYRASTAVLGLHRSLAFRGPAVASLSIPWGFNKGDDDLGGYHLVWPRDLVETAGGYLACGLTENALEILAYLRTIQEEDGHWPQNAWLDGTPYWTGVQMDECGFPLLLLDALHRMGTLTGEDLAAYLPMAERAVAYLLQNGPVTGEDRWEEDAGYSPFTLAVEIAALLAAADTLEACGRAAGAALARETADCWNEQIERWTYVRDNGTARALSIEGYYVRIAAADTADAASPSHGFVPIKNRPPESGTYAADAIVSPDALALVRFGLRAADDPRILATVKVIDAKLCAALPQGPVWYRYSEDGYGEKADGGPFDGTGIGRPWPLLTGERAHYEIAAGRLDRAGDLLETFAACAGPGGLLPEQVWDGEDLPERELMRGGPSGSAMPLVWAHAEYIKLLRSLKDGRVFDMPPQGPRRYLRDATGSAIRIWRFNNRIREIPPGKALRLDLTAAATLRWSADDWTSVQESRTAAPLFGLHSVTLPVADLPAGTRIAFTFFWTEAQHWEGEDFAVEVVAEPEAPSAVG